MMDMESIFKHRRPVAEKLKEYGFTIESDEYQMEIPIMNGQFTVFLRITLDEKVDFRVFDTQSGDEYVLARVPDASGSFVGEVRGALENVFNDISQKCFEPEFFKGSQTKRILCEMKEKYHTEPEFLWPTALPECAALRIPGKKTWFAVVGRVERAKFGLAGGGVIEVINLKDEPGSVVEKIEKHIAYPAYHMNKKNWYSVFLDDSVSDADLLEIIAKSYALVNP